MQNRIIDEKILDDLQINGYPELVINEIRHLPYIVKELEPEIAGVLVIAEGGNNEVIKSDVIAAVQVLFDVPAHKIKVMKMNH